MLILSGAVLAIDKVRAMPPAVRHAYQVNQASTVKTPYLLIAGVLLALTLVIALFKLPAISTHLEPSAKKSAEGKVWHYRHLTLGVVAIFVYVGAEVAIGSFLVKYLSRPEIGGLTEKMAGTYISVYWGCAMIGRFIGSAILQKLRPAYVLGVAALIAFALVGTTMLTFGSVAMWSVLIIGLFNSIMFPTIFTLGIADLGPLTGEASGLLVMGIVGGAVIPYVQGAIADQIGIHHAFLLPLICYLYIAFYGFIGSKPKQTVARAA
jgi:FHS family L-fucose permease-like MFS transporter